MSKVKINITFVIILAISIFAYSELMAQEKSDTNSSTKSKTESKIDVPYKKIEPMKPKGLKKYQFKPSKENQTSKKNKSELKEEKKKESIIHGGVIDLKTIDKNNDGKVYQDMMDWNVISDKPGKCPLCGMKLKEVTLETAKKNLIENGFKVKE
ncbi:MAG: hypothetical protein KJ666_15660 [Bacteroidetes bacterium]|nr:hypothetical protein [Bacteroidota bacterium]MBU2584401.1 hypothetical protein [Bacteroidota bacterium]